MLKISINMILDSLASYQPDRLFPDTENLFFSGLRLYERDSKGLSPENIYICNSQELTGEAITSGCCFLCIHRGLPGLKERLQGHRFVVLENSSISLAEVFNTV